MTFTLSLAMIVRKKITPKYFVIHIINSIKKYMDLLFLNIAEGGYKLYLTTFEKDKLISYGEEPLAFQFGDIGYIVSSKAQMINDTTFHTTKKEWFRGDLKVHQEIFTNIDIEGQVFQDKKVIINKEINP